MTKTEARKEGRAAYGDGETPHCPYPRDDGEDTNSKRVAWYDGYYEARLADKLPKHFTLEPI